MKIIYKYGLVPLAAVLGVCWHLATAAVQEHAPAPAPQVIDDLPADYAADLTAEQRTLVERGRYVARLGDCVACHTGSKTAPMAGGLALETPFGKLYSTNITPDKATGMGGYSFAQFDRAMRKGVAADGRNLYPAMPYPSYAKMTEDDMQALYAYLMQGVTPVQAANQPSEMGFPFNQRWGLSLWNWLFLDDTPSSPRPAERRMEPRRLPGAGPGPLRRLPHPRGIGFQEKTMTSEGPNGKLFLAGKPWRLARTEPARPVDTPGHGRDAQDRGNRHGTVSGNMVDVVQHSTQYMSDGTCWPSAPT
jgi:thiosulfate dehydrogenase